MFIVFLLSRAMFILGKHYCVEIEKSIRYYFLLGVLLLYLFLLFVVVAVSLSTSFEFMCISVVLYEWAFVCNVEEIHLAAITRLNIYDCSKWHEFTHQVHINKCQLTVSKSQLTYSRYSFYLLHFVYLAVC